MSMHIGESFVGEGAEAAHVNTVLGARSGPAGTAWATALATPRAGHVPFVAVLRPGLPAKPATLFVNKAAVETGAHAKLTWGAAQAGVAAGVMDAVAEGVVAETDLDRLVLIAAVWVDPKAADAGLVYTNNREATRTALRNGATGLPTAQQALAVRDTPANPFYAQSPGSL